MKFHTALALAACLFLLPAGAWAETASYISSVSYHSFSAGSGGETRSSSSSSLFYTDGAGRLTNFEAETEDGVMTVTIRQDGAVVWKRAIPVKSNFFSVSRREELGHVYFLMTAGDRGYRAEPDRDGKWAVEAEEEPRIVGL